MLKQIKNIKKKLAIRRMLKQYDNMLVVELIMEDWITKRILDGQRNRRKELVEKQDRIKEMNLFIEYLKKL